MCLCFVVGLGVSSDHNPSVNTHAHSPAQPAKPRPIKPFRDANLQRTLDRQKRMQERSKRGADRDKERLQRSATDAELDRQAQEKIPSEFADILKKNRERAQADIDSEKATPTQTQTAAQTKAEETKEAESDSPGFFASLWRKTTGLFSAAKTAIVPGPRSASACACICAITHPTQTH